MNKFALPEEELRALIEGGNSTYKAAEKFGVSQSKVRYWMRVHNIQPYIPDRTCRNCGEKRSHRNEFCTKDCFHEHRQKTYISAWFSGLETGVKRNGQISGFVRSWMRSQVSAFGSDCCWKCGWNKVNPNTMLVAVEIDHIDGDWQNNKPENLQLLCPNCHAIEPTSFRGMDTPRRDTERPDWLNGCRNTSLRYRVPLETLRENTDERPSEKETLM
jgi:hypothetical protein